MAKNFPPIFFPRSKYYASKTIWFREEVNKREIKFFKIETVDQLGDIFTKGLLRGCFDKLDCYPGADFLECMDMNYRLIQHV